MNSLYNVTSGANNSMIDLDNLLMDYEMIVEQAVDNGINVVTQDFSINWDYSQAIFFVITILTTIGYGHFAPVTWPGRLFCIFFAIVGIPFTLSVIADMGQIIANIISVVWDKYKQRLQPILHKLRHRKKKQKSATSEE